MQTRWMLWLELDNTLRMLGGIPRLWLIANSSIELKDVASYFGHFNFELKTDKKVKKVDIKINFKENRLPEKLEIRVPHPEELKAKKASGGSYDPNREMIIIEQPSRNNTISVVF